VGVVVRGSSANGRAAPDRAAVGVQMGVGVLGASLRRPFLLESSRSWAKRRRGSRQSQEPRAPASESQPRWHR
jgi:hypothetical protein